MNICIFASSSDAVSSDFLKAAGELGELIGKKGYTLVYGGTNVGLMGEIAVSVQKNGGKVIGVIPWFIRDEGISNSSADQLIVTEDMYERKRIMEDMSDAFFALPGGFGTLEEIFEVLTLKQLKRHNKPIIFFNTKGFYNRLFDFFEQIYKEKFAKSAYKNTYYITSDPQDALSYLENYSPTEIPDKWFK
ncbi:MAG: TIGR00730 family Rossman fold protein [Candidatus Methanoliparum thermophilum]|uniref:TIGR00730 family Rossman fold protein n=1 Tax=Methanoliparum thermophilum TaxID=2491083 RepID=A0A520KSB3_METT2|nr:TIGR00730 family Rossman fold protein [Candidatus Methanoliparum sp. LAM-1]RZN64811.1 MAG: TIGR00730 family Rossman fold protein [Candidatus Methanoliparum thermophilum]BDC36320.1 hypothetical protein MTLP_10020 [Candidatus Methanoliparum sp. LAM-1]